MKSDGYMLDTNIINRLIDGLWDISQLPTDAPCYVTHIQRDELAKTQDAERRKQLLTKLEEIAPKMALTESMIEGISRVGECRLSDGIQYEEILNELDKAKKRANNPQDALIAETALKLGFTLVSADTTLINVMTTHGGRTLTVK